MSRYPDQRHAGPPLRTSSSSMDLHQPPSPNDLPMHALSLHHQSPVPRHPSYPHAPESPSPLRRDPMPMQPPVNTYILQPINHDSPAVGSPRPAPSGRPDGLANTPVSSSSTNTTHTTDPRLSTPSPRASPAMTYSQPRMDLYDPTLTAGFQQQQPRADYSAVPPPGAYAAYPQQQSMYYPTSNYNGALPVAPSWGYADDPNAYYADPRQQQSYYYPSDPYQYDPSVRPSDATYMVSATHSPAENGITVADDTAYATANASPKKASKNQLKFPPATTENLNKFRAQAKASRDPKIELDLAKYLLEAVRQVRTDPKDPKRSRKIKEALTTEAQKIVKKLVSQSSGLGKTSGYPDAVFFMATCYGSGQMGLSVDVEKAFSLYLQGSKQSHPESTYRVAVCYETGLGTKRDKGHAMQFYRKAANLGDPAAMLKLGMILLNGLLGQQKTPREAISWLKRAAQRADEEHPQALHELGLALESENLPGVIPDVNHARDLYTQAAQYGYAPSQFRLGLAYENGFLNCPVDPRRSIAWYSKAAEQGDVESELALSGWYLTGAEGVLNQSDTEAYLWARKAAEKGSSKAEYAVGYYTETGIGVKQNLDDAKKWYMRAAAQNNRKAMQRLTELKKQGPNQMRKRQQHTRPTNGAKPNNSDNSDCRIM
ncbi:uncharacterized protein BYT42DRAFT_575784 [Radiomyces spectabilis]|uniref:uncharacterized protein n=1 Tax=Radiomyces spectabilis TaxID=64574 RepID=UPI00222102B8|nr:uncharacterized protein BYT42DRAFT_575784 [Radiomyces spectabilis]KAI8374273.1 hypothetical protein BYT42DRAFT_575784 [Radiomyces spectabilis]